MPYQSIQTAARYLTAAMSLLTGAQRSAAIYTDYTGATKGRAVVADYNKMIIKALFEARKWIDTAIKKLGGSTEEPEEDDSIR